MLDAARRITVNVQNLNFNTKRAACAITVTASRKRLTPVLKFKDEPRS